MFSTLTPNGSGGELVQYHHPDRLGTRLVTNAQDTTYFEQVTLPFGTALNAESTGFSNRRFTSYDRSATTGLDYAINRHYDPQQGRFTQVDPIGMRAASPSDPQSLNMYAYCGNDPVNHTDPEGLFFGKLFKWFKKIIKWAVIAVAVIAAVALTVAAIAGGGGSGAAFASFLWDSIVTPALSILSQLAGFGPAVGMPTGPGGTPNWNPNAGSILNGGSSKLSRYIIYNYSNSQTSQPGLASIGALPLFLLPQDPTTFKPAYDRLTNDPKKIAFLECLQRKADETGKLFENELDAELKRRGIPDGPTVMRPGRTAASAGVGAVAKWAILGGRLLSVATLAGAAIGVAASVAVENVDNFIQYSQVESEVSNRLYRSGVTDPKRLTAECEKEVGLK